MKLVLAGAFETPFLGKGRSYGVSDGTIGKSDGGLLLALHYDHCAISNHSVALPSNVCNAQINTGWVTLEQKGLTSVSQILKRSGRDMGLSHAKQNCRKLHVTREVSVDR